MSDPVISAPIARRLTIAEDIVPALARGTKLRFDAVRDRWVLLVPERVLAPDDTAVEVLQLCDGARSVAAIVDALAEKYAAPREEIAGDVIEMLQDLADSAFITSKGGRS